MGAFILMLFCVVPTGGGFSIGAISVDAGLLFPAEPTGFISEECGANLSTSNALRVGLQLERSWKKFGPLGLSYGSEIGFWKTEVEGDTNTVEYTCIPMGVFGGIRIAPPLFPLSLWLKLSAKTPYIKSHWDKDFDDLNGWGFGFDANVGLSYSILPMIYFNASGGFEQASLMVERDGETDDITISGPKFALGVSIGF